MAKFDGAPRPPVVHKTFSIPSGTVDLTLGPDPEFAIWT